MTRDDLQQLVAEIQRQQVRTGRRRPRPRRLDRISSHHTALADDNV